MNHSILCILLFMLSLPQSANSQSVLKDSSQHRKYFIGSTFFVLGNLIEKNRPDFVQVNLGYRIRPEQSFSVELKTWKYAWSLGIPYGKSFEAPEERFPGYVREKGIALVYQYFWWKRFYSSIHVMSAWQKFVPDDGTASTRGFQIFNTYRAGYQFRLFRNRIFIEPSIAVTHRPYHTKMPERFKSLDDKWSKFFFPEPGLHFGVNF